MQTNCIYIGKSQGRVFNEKYIPLNYGMTGNVYTDKQFKDGKYYQFYVDGEGLDIENGFMVHKKHLYFPK